eukprot:TRINITY_DN34750_c0_g1_i1.p1 TRINITY_DN34750_c0_g1~~TRINITY_DN34750_c0_g1_i1.p1  ORF type:complete len:177 (-),score=1.30 TRINITY_DN34750_c0_g1_i1:104-634(-)
MLVFHQFARKEFINFQKVQYNTPKKSPFYRLMPFIQYLQVNRNFSENQLFQPCRNKLHKKYCEKIRNVLHGDATAVPLLTFCCLCQIDIESQVHKKREEHPRFFSRKREYPIIQSKESQIRTVWDHEFQQEIGFVKKLVRICEIPKLSIHISEIRINKIHKSELFGQGDSGGSLDF